MASWSLSLVVLARCSHPKGGEGPFPSHWMRTGRSESQPDPLWSLLRGEVWPSGDPRKACHSILVCPLCPGPGHVAFISGLLCSPATRSVWPMGTLEGDGDPGLLPSGLWWAGSVSQPQLLSCQPSTQVSLTAASSCPFRPRGRNTWGRNGVTNHLGLPGTVPSVCT